MASRVSFTLLLVSGILVRAAQAGAIAYPDGCSTVKYSSAMGPNVKDFPDGFLFGAATSAAQVEGAAFIDGRTASIWDHAAAEPGFIADGSTPYVADDNYHTFKDDIKRLADAGFKAYRFSISWSRLIPDNTRSVNQQGVNFYNALIDALIDHGIEPAATIFHWDLPQYLQDSKGGWLSESIVDDFTFFADTCFKNFGDRVKIWMSLNEPGQCSVQGYGTGGFAPRRCSDRRACTDGDSTTEPYQVAHHFLLSHASAVNLYRTAYQPIQGGKIGIALDSQFFYPIDNQTANVDAANRGMEFAYGWFADPIMFGHYPASMQTYVGSRLPTFTAEQARMLKGSADFLGINFYTATYAWQGHFSGPGTPWIDSQVMTSQTSPNTGTDIGMQTASPWLKVVPSGIRDMLRWISNRYNNVPVFVTENGSSDPNSPSIPLLSALCDIERIQYYQEYLTNVQLAIKDGVNVKGYFAWSLLDNWEWAQGYTQRFGLFFVNFTDAALPRYAKASAAWFADFLTI